MARRSKFTPKACKTILDHIKLGMPYKFAATAAGVDYTTFNKWVNKGKEQETGQYHDFYNEVQEAEAIFVRNNLARIAKAATEGSWQAAVWMLKIRHPDEFTEVIKTDNKNEHSGQIVVNLVRKSFRKEDNV
jgi:hypothetical protein